jgi:hypothetical protein
MKPMDAHRRVYDSVANLLAKAGVTIG